MKTTTPNSIVSIACAQMRPVLGDVDANTRHGVELIEKAADQGAQLVVLPELCNTGYMFRDAAEARQYAETVPDGPTCRAWAAAAQARGVHIVAGIDEKEGDALYNAAVLIGPDGRIGVYRKMHLWDNEKTMFAPGNLGFPVFDTPLGKIGLAVCYDCWFPETFRLCALQGADMMCVPTNWVPIPGQRENREAMANILVMAAAHSNSIVIAAADRVGVERGQAFIGQSLVVDHTGWPVAGPAGAEEEEIIICRVDMAKAKSSRQWNAHNRALADRRSDVYDEMLGSGIPAGRY